ncbi:hypothetical protein [Agromyces sp. NPDC055661]
MTRTFRAGALTAAAISLMLALAGCVGPTPTPTPDAATPRPTVTAAPTAEPVDPLTTVTSIVLRPEALDLVDAAGATVEALSYDLPAVAFVDALAIAIGAEPEIEEAPGHCCETPASIHYRWPGLEVWDDQVGGWDDADPTVWIPNDGPDLRDMNLVVIAGAPDSHGTPLTTVRGVQAGADAAALAEDVGMPYVGDGFDAIPVETGPELGPPSEHVLDVRFAGQPNAYSVVLQSLPDGSTRLLAPHNVGIAGV